MFLFALDRVLCVFFLVALSKAADTLKVYAPLFGGVARNVGVPDLT